MNSRKLLLAGWDAADWKVIDPLMAAGKMPNVRRLAENGAVAHMTTLHPPLSPMLWTSIATGKRAFKHGIHGFAEPAPDGRGVQPITNLSRKSKALWNILNQNGLRSIVIGWWPSHPAEPIDGVMLSDHFHRVRGQLEEGWPLPAHSVHPAELAGTLAGVRVHPELLPPELVEEFIPLAREIDQDQDRRLGTCARILAECMSIHSAAMWLLENQRWDFFAVYYDAIDHFCHVFMKYHPPRQAWVSERDFELYHNVVSMAYRFHDRMLGALLDRAGPDTTAILISDHGFHPDHLRPASIPNIPAGPAIEHRDLGIFAMSGPGVKKRELLRGVSVLDVAPTVLTVFGLPVGEDMDGKVVSTAFAEAPDVAFVPSWEDIPGPDGCHSPHTRVDPVAAHEALERMIALGYIERPSEDIHTAVQKTIRELRYNLGEAYQDAGRHPEALEIFRELCEADPGEQRVAVRMFVSCQALGLRQEMRRILDRLEGRATTAGRLPPLVHYLEAQALTEEKRYREALAALDRLIEREPARPSLLIECAGLYLRLNRGRDARRLYEKALALDRDSVDAFLGLCRMALRRGKYASAAQLALDALQRNYHLPTAHLLLARALTGMREYERAAEAFRAAISLNPNFPEAHVRLAALLEKYEADPQSARRHRLLARRMRRGERVRLLDPVVRPERYTAPFSGRHEKSAAAQVELAPLEQSLIVVTGLPRSGTSMLMQMLAAGGIEVLSDDLRKADDNNPHGYLEFEPVTRLAADSGFLAQACGKAVKIVAPLLAALPPGLPCRAILVERDLDEILESQERMLAGGNGSEGAPRRRGALKLEYARILERANAILASRPGTQVLAIDYHDAVYDPSAAARTVNAFLGGGLRVGAMAAAIDPVLYRNRAHRFLCSE